ncbi:hypothetical protein ACS0TY_011019 [Phlomoides rotata]
MDLDSVSLTERLKELEKLTPVDEVTANEGPPNPEAKLEVVMTSTPIVGTESAIPKSQDEGVRLKLSFTVCTCLISYVSLLRCNRNLQCHKNLHCCISVDDWIWKFLWVRYSSQNTGLLLGGHSRVRSAWGYSDPVAKVKLPLLHELNGTSTQALIVTFG